MKYTFTAHIHNFALWASARSVQRNFTNTKNIKSAIEAASLIKLIDNTPNFSIDEFDAFHKKTAYAIIKHLQSIDKNLSAVATYGRAAKIIAIYIKTISVIRDTGKSKLAMIAHPPIDSILLSNLHKEYKGFGFNKYKWTQLNKNEYFDLINKLRSLNYHYFWEVEEYWEPV